MDTQTAQYRQIIETLLQDYASFLGQEEGIQRELIFDRDHHHYLLLEAGWQNNRRIYGPFIHLDIIDGKIWIQRDGTEDGIANELVSAGIPVREASSKEKDVIVLGFHEPSVRPHTGFAVA